MYVTNASQRQFVREAVRQGIRPDGRANNHYRKPFLKSGVITQANGSVSVSYEYQQVSFYVTIKLQVVKETPSINLRIESIMERDEEESTLQVMTDILSQHLVKHIPTTDFVIANSKSSLKVFIDVLLMSYPHYNLMDTISLAIKSAFRNLSIPLVKALVNQMTGEEQIEIEEAQKGFTGEIPSVLVIGEVEGQLVCDMTSEEFESMDSVMVMSLGEADTVFGIYQMKGQIDPEATLKTIRFAQKLQQQLKHQ